MTTQNHYLSTTLKNLSTHLFLFLNGDTTVEGAQNRVFINHKVFKENIGFLFVTIPHNPTQ